MESRDNILLYTLIALVVLLVGASDFRFILAQDYVAAYEGACDPAASVCFIGCEDDACTEEYYYANVEKYAADLYAQCGADITDCASANACQINDRKCSVTYCDPETDGDACETLGEESNTSIDTQPSGTEESLRQGTVSSNVL